MATHFSACPRAGLTGVPPVLAAVLLGKNERVLVMPTRPLSYGNPRSARSPRSGSGCWAATGGPASARRSSLATSCASTRPHRCAHNWPCRMGCVPSTRFGWRVSSRDIGVWSGPSRGPATPGPPRQRGGREAARDPLGIKPLYITGRRRAGDAGEMVVRDISGEPFRPRRQPEHRLPTLVAVVGIGWAGQSPCPGGKQRSPGGASRLTALRRPAPLEHKVPPANPLWTLG